MRRDSFLFYRSFYEAIKDLPRDIQGEVYTAIMEYGLNGITTENLKPVARSIFTLIKPVLDFGNKQYSNGLKGGRPRKEETQQKPTENPTETQQKPYKDKEEDMDKDKDKEEDDEQSEIALSGSGGTPTKPESINFENLVANFNRVTKGVFGVVQLPLSEQRKKCIRARIREHGKEIFMEVIRKAAASDFLKGQNQRGFTATFDWLIKPSNFEKVLSGNYDNHSGAAVGGQGYKGDATIGTDFSYKE